MSDPLEEFAAHGIFDPFGLDLDVISDKWLRSCGACDAGIGECIHPAEDYRPTMLALVGEITKLRQDLEAALSDAFNAGENER